MLRWFLSNTLAKEITLVLVIKLGLICSLWYAFFRVPPNQLPGDRDVSRMILGHGTDLRNSP